MSDGKEKGARGGKDREQGSDSKKHVKHDPNAESARAKFGKKEHG